MALLWTSGAVAAEATASSTPPSAQALPSDLPTVVAQGLARSVGARPASAAITLNVDMQVREDAQLHQLIEAASAPGSLDYGDYLTHAQYLARFAPTSGEVEDVEAWLRGQGLDVTGSTPDRAIVHVHTTVALAEHAFAVTIDDYVLRGQEFFANDRAPSVPSDLHIESVGGLTNYGLPRTDHICSDKLFCGYYGTEFRTAYDVVGNGERETIGFTVWGQPLPQKEYDEYAKLTGTKPLIVGGSGANGLDFIEVDGPSSVTEAAGEIALDTENAHAVAPGIHEVYWLGSNNEDTTLEDTLNAAAESDVHIISDSWDSAGYDSCAVYPGFETALEQGAATGKTFFFSTGDYSAEEGCHSPSSSPYAIAVGGTDLLTGPKGEWKSETAIEDDGGCSDSEARPWWQTGIGSPLEYPSTPCEGRATPDVSADSCYSGDEHFPSGECWAEIFAYGVPDANGGTSLASPLWAAGSAVWNKDNAVAKRPPLGFVAPLLYRLANDPSYYAEDYHDIVSGSNGFAAGPGWDEATGWGSPNFKNLETTAAEPVAQTSEAYEITQTATILGAGVNPEGVKVTACKFEYGTTTKYGSSAPCSSSPGSGTGLVDVSAAIKALKPGTTYHFRISATNSAGTAKGADETFATAPERAAVAETRPASDITDATATLTADVDPRLGEVTKCVFEYGTTTKYGSSVSCSKPPPPIEGFAEVSAPLKGLKAATTYYFRVSVTSDAGTSAGGREEFTTG